MLKNKEGKSKQDPKDNETVVKGFKKNKTIFTASKNAINGIIHVFKTERNLRIDYLIGATVLFLSLFFDFTKTEIICLILTVGFVIFAEMINSTVEYMTDLITEQYNEKARAAKDIAAGGVLMATGAAVLVAYFLFADKIKGASTMLLADVLGSRGHVLVTILFISVILTIIFKGVFSKKPSNFVEAFPSTRVTISFALATYLYIITKSFIVGGVSFALGIIIYSLKKETDKVSTLHVLLSAMLGVLIVLIIYQLTLFAPTFSNVTWKIF